MGEFSKVSGHKTNTEKSVVMLYANNIKKETDIKMQSHSY